LFGLDEFHVTGALGDYDRSERLHELAVPTMFTCGHYDDSTPEYTGWLCSLVPDAEMVVFGQAAHMAHLEEPEHYVQVVRDFLRRVEN
jgi:proline iminopeptidase